MSFFIIKDKEYPKLLKKIGKDTPEKLYYKGILDDKIFENCLAVVGSRRMTIYGKQVTEKIVTELASAGLTIVSGFMYGIDATSHRVALIANGRTIAVMPCGIDLIHPEYQKELYNEILSNNGLIISEYKEKTQPAKWTYPQRNRIVAGLSQAVLIVEAEEKSGSLITANWAKKFKRKIFVIPGPITSKNSKGIMQLIKEGATPISSAQEILQYYKLQITNHKLQTNPKSKIPNSQMTIEQKILEQLKRESLGLGVDELARVFAMPVSQIGVILSMMQLKGLIKQQGIKYYVN